MAERIHIATVSHRHGTNIYAAKSEAGAYRQLAEYCREWWAETGIKEQPGEDDGAVISAYFESDGIGGEEFYEMGEAELRD
jgi:hypothetical protein